MTILIIGLGSIGKRHVRLLKSIAPDCRLIAVRSGKGSSNDECVETYQIRQVFSLEDGISETPDFAIVSNPTSHHLYTALALARAGIPFFLEKPVANSLEHAADLLKIVHTKKLPVLVGFQLRHHPSYQKLKNLLSEGRIGKPLHCESFVGHYLPSWRPGTDYTTCYSARKELGGGVVLDLTHQMDLTCSFLGAPLEVCCMCGKFTDLKIDVEDIADILIHHENNTLSHIHLNYLEQEYTWLNRISGTHGSIIWDYGKGQLRIEGTTTECWEVPSGYTRDDMYKTQMEHFIRVVKGIEAPAVDLDTGLLITKVALCALQSSRDKKFVPIIK